MKGSGGSGDSKSLQSRTGLSSISIWIVLYFAGVLHKMAMNFAGKPGGRATLIDDGPARVRTGKGNAPQL
jgi:hypothetical protein